MMNLTSLVDSGIIDTMDTTDKVNLKVPVETRQKIRLIAALTGEQLMEVIDRLAEQELARLQKKQPKTK